MITLNQESLIIALICLIIGFLIGYIIQQIRIKNSQEQIQWLQNKQTELEKNKTELLLEVKELEKSLYALELHAESLNKENKEQKSDLLKLQEKFKNDFELLAHQILEKNSNKFTEQNQRNIAHILKPLSERIQAFENQLLENTKEHIAQHTSLKEQIKSLRELNVQVNEEAINLTRALKGDAKMRGNWGELILERVLEKSGLEKGREYTTQKAFIGLDGKSYIPDVVINLPEQKHIIIDSKVSLIAYEQYVNEEDELAKSQFLKQHIQSIHRHVEDLSSKNYQQLADLESPGFVLLFIPIEPAFALVLEADAQLYNKAFEKNIVIVTPTTLLATLRTIDSMWTNEKQQKNAIEIANNAGKLYDTFVSLVEEFERLGKQIDTTQRTFERAQRKLTGRGNMLRRIEDLKKMGATASKQLAPHILKEINSEEE